MQFRTLFAAAFAVGAAHAQNATNLTLTDAISSNDQLSSLGTLLQAYPNVASSLANATNVTLLAPNNQAINTLLGSLNSTGTNFTEAQVAALLNYHVLNATIYAANVTSTPAFVPTLLNDTAYSNVTGGQVIEAVRENDSVMIYSGLRNNATVVTADVSYAGGVIHIIDSVLTIPLNVSATALIAGLTDIVGALTLANISTQVDGMSDITVFAPTNNAFTEIGSALSNVSTTDLVAILQYHVLSGVVGYSSTLTNGTAATAQGNNITVTIEDGAIFINQARVVIADVLVAEGVCHVIDSVLNPNNTSAAPEPSASTAAPAFSGASSASVDLTSGLPSATTTAGAGLTSTNPSQATGYTPTASSIGDNPLNTASASSSGIAAHIPMATGAIGAAALFGAGALIANL